MDNEGNTPILIIKAPTHGEGIQANGDNYLAFVLRLALLTSCSHICQKV